MKTLALLFLVLLSSSAWAQSIPDTVPPKPAWCYPITGGTFFLEIHDGVLSHWAVERTPGRSDFQFYHQKFENRVLKESGSLKSLTELPWRVSLNRVGAELYLSQIDFQKAADISLLDSTGSMIWSSRIAVPTGVQSYMYSVTNFDNDFLSMASDLESMTIICNNKSGEDILTKPFRSKAKATFVGSSKVDTGYAYVNGIVSGTSNFFFVAGVTVGEYSIPIENRDQFRLPTISYLCRISPTHFDTLKVFGDDTSVYVLAVIRDNIVAAMQDSSGHSALWFLDSNGLTVNQRALPFPVRTQIYSLKGRYFGTFSDRDSIRCYGLDSSLGVLWATVTPNPDHFGDIDLSMVGESLCMSISTYRGLTLRTYDTAGRITKNYFWEKTVLGPGATSYAVFESDSSFYALSTFLDTLCYYTTATLGVRPVAPSALQLVQLPSGDNLLAFENPWPSEGAQYSVLNLLGQSVLTGICRSERLEFSSTTLTAGVYHLTVVSPNGETRSCKFLRP